MTTGGHPRLRRPLTGLPRQARGWYKSGVVATKALAVPGRSGLGWVLWDDVGVSRRDELVDLVSGLDADPRIALAVVRRLQELVDEELLAQVSRARKVDMSWAVIGEVLGVTAQAVHKRFAWMV